MICVKFRVKYTCLSSCIAICFGLTDQIWISFLHIMSRQSRFSEEHKKAPVIVPSRVNSSNSDDDTVLASEQVAWNL